MTDPATSPDPTAHRPRGGRWIVSQIGAREHYATARALHQRGRLERMYTDVWATGAWQILAKLPGPLRRMAARQHPALPGHRVTAFTGASLLRTALASSADPYLEYAAYGEWFGRRVAANLARRDLDPAHHRAFLYNTGALESLHLLRGRGIPTIVDQIDLGRVEEEIVLAECERWPGWQTAPARIPAVYFDRLTAEWSLADAVVVNSEWSRQALVTQGVPAEKIAVVPLAYEPGPIAPPAPKPPGTLHVLWLGQVILRKGIQYLLEAAKLLQGQNIRITVTGPIGISDTAVASASSNVTISGPVPRDRAADVYRQADVFVLPTLSDGFAITQLEAMSHGLPVIATPRCGEVVSDGVDGLIVPPADPAALAEAIASLHRDCDRRIAMSIAAREKVRQFGLSRYADGIEGSLPSISSSGTA